MLHQDDANTNVPCQPQRGDVRVEADHAVEEVAHVGHAETFQQSMALCVLGRCANTLVTANTALGARAMGANLQY